MFALNGGPGSSAVWLHLGALGPKLVPTTEDGTETLAPPVTLIDNPHSILDVAALRNAQQIKLYLDVQFILRRLVGGSAICHP